MKTFAFDIEDDTPDNPAIGLIVLQTDETMEHELRHWLPGNLRLFHTRIPNSVVISSDTLQQMKQQIPGTVSLLPPSTRYRVIVYGCTSASTVIGEQGVSDAVRSIFPDVAVTNPLTAIKARLSALKARRIALLTPYVLDVSQALIDALQATGVEVVQVGSFQEERDDRVARISRASLQQAVQSLADESPVDAVVTSCTNLRTYGLVESMSESLGIPVISSNSALAWHVQALLRG